MFARYRAAFLALPLMFASVPAMAAMQQPASGEASIPFVNHGGSGTGKPMDRAASMCRTSIANGIMRS